ncbi:MAG: response regulator transcription factor [Anaerolineales bacterium]|nr:response regulator transcription factor [Anaerolineales bacterium]HUV27053.1 response regulator transcription factor [Anaerolineales bacterium]
MPKTILIVDDEKRILSLLKAYLEQQGFGVATAANGKDALFVARQEKPDLIILDVMMPEMDGYEFMRQHRKERETPIILLTARVDEDDKVIGLELGADDYVTKPFSPRELTSRVRAVLRRTGQSLPQSEVFRQGGVTLDRDSHLVTLDEEIVDLTPSEFDLLAVLMSAPGRTFTRLELLDQIQDTAFVGYARTIDVHIKNLRAKIEQNPRQPRYIETVYGVGYRFAAR